MRDKQRRRRTSEPKREPELEVRVERILPGGMGLAHAEGRTILVGLAAPGDLLRVRIESVRGRVAFASIVEVIEPSPVRIEPPCPYFGRCGGCDFQQMDYRSQLEAKVEIIRDCMRRIARIEPGEIHITASPLEWRYRARAQWQHDDAHGRMGYYERGSHRVCDVAECPVLVPELQATLSALRERMSAGSLPPHLEDFQAVAGDEGVSLAPTLSGEEPMEASRVILDNRYLFSAEGFFQINQSLLPSLVAHALDDAHGDTAVDLYCGVGLFTLPLARRFREVVGVEGNPSAASYARRNLQHAELPNAQVECSGVGLWLKENARRRAPVDLVLLDPPRAGLEEGAAQGLLDLRPRRINYVSCDPATLARDLREIIAGGYTLKSLAAFDMFPQTHHVETVALLRTEIT
ncbi:MAG TPA: class I SAM-dependent RNA methyltransferase [Pyrinomonadaceae bacterium]|nr:class I SAM-dependent RNA methyltransferase [Pyrinomonadaceae bacterium]